MVKYSILNQYKEEVNQYKEEMTELQHSDELSKANSK